MFLLISCLPCIMFKKKKKTFQILPRTFRQVRARIFTKNCIYLKNKIFIHICTMGLDPKISALQLGKVENVKFNHDLNTIFWDF